MSKEKRDTLAEVLNTPAMTRIHINASHPGVEVPDQHKGDPALMLNISRRFGTALALNADAVRADLSFGGRPFNVVIPWEALWGISKPNMGVDIVWDESMATPVRAAWLEHKAMVEAQTKEAKEAEKTSREERAERVRKSGLKIV